jgi:hypothetical protein
MSRYTDDEWLEANPRSVLFDSRSDMRGTKVMTRDTADVPSMLRAQSGTVVSIGNDEADRTIYIVQIGINGYAYRARLLAQHFTLT